MWFQLYYVYYSFYLLYNIMLSYCYTLTFYLNYTMLEYLI